MARKIIDQPVGFLTLPISAVWSASDESVMPMVPEMKCSKGAIRSNKCLFTKEEL